MADRRKERDEKLKQLKNGMLKGKPKADFHFKMAKILERELNRLEELSSLLDATPDSYLTKINFNERAIAAMSLTEIIIKRTNPAHIVEKDGAAYATKKYMLKNFPAFEELDNSVMVLQVKYEPLPGDLSFDNRLKEFLKSMNMVVNDPLDPLAHSIEEYNSVIAPRIRAHSKNGKFGLMNPPIMYTPAEDSDPNARIEDALTGKREAIFQLETAKEPNQQPPK